MGLLWRLFAPKPLKKARRSVRKVDHPVRTLTPKPIKQVRGTTYRAVHPVEGAEHGLENQIVRAVQSQRRSSTASRSPVVAANGATSAEVRAWARRSGYLVADKGRLPAHIVDAYNRAQ